jgi:hypothetical protein
VVPGSFVHPPVTDAGTDPLPALRVFIDGLALLAGSTIEAWAREIDVAAGAADRDEAAAGAIPAGLAACTGTGLALCTV